MPDPLGGLVSGLLAQIVGELASDLVESMSRDPRGAGLVDRPVRLDRHRPGPLRPRRLGSSEIDRLVTGLSEKVAGARRAAPHTLPDHEWAGALAAVRDTLRRSAPIDATLVVTGARLDPERLEHLLRARAQDVVEGAALSERGLAAYDEMLRLACAHVIEFITSRPEFAVWANREAVQQSGEILDRVTNLQQGFAAEVVRAADDAGRGRQNADDEVFTRRYAEYLSSRLDALELVGVTLRRTPRRYALDLAYTNLSVARVVPLAGEAVDATDGLTGSGISVTEALAGSPRVVLRGTAGSGKSTTLQWLAVRAARGLLDEAATGPDHDRLRRTPDRPVPLLLPLRRFVTRRLPSPGDLLTELTRPLAHAAPPGWIDRLLVTGRALLLIDGVDEVPSRTLEEDPGQAGRLTVRADVETWLDELVAAYPRANYVVTTRLSAVPEGWLSRLGFDTFDLLPMGPGGIRDLVERWHDAVAHDVPAPQAARLERNRSTLPALLATRPELHRLAATPLLCALICALNWDRQMELPTDRAGLYEAALDMLLDRRDLQRGVAAPEGVELSAREQRALLQRLAYFLVRNETSELTEPSAVSQLQRALSRVRARDASPTSVLRHLITRTGLLRADPVSGGIHFAHRTFQDYLGAREALEEGDLGLLVSRGHDDRWLDVIVMATGQARPREAGTILAGLLERGDRDPALRARLHLVAAAAVAQTVVVEPAEIRDRVTRATADLIPPTTEERAQALARAGEFVIDLLPGPDGLDETAAALVVRTAALIGTEAARDLILRFIPGEPAPRILDELLRAWRTTPLPDEYARTVLAAVPFGDVTVAVHRHRLPYLRYLPQLRSVRHLGDFVDLHVFATAPGLRRLELFQNDVVRDRHLSALAGCPRLTELALVRCGSLRDLSGLAGTRINDLTLTFTDRVDVVSLAPLESLRRLRIRLPRMRNLDDLPETLRLTDLAFGSRLPEASLRGIERLTALETVEILGAPSADDVQRLVHLPNLRRLIATGSGQPWAAALHRARPEVEVLLEGEEGASSVA